MERDGSEEDGLSAYEVQRFSSSQIQDASRGRD